MYHFRKTAVIRSRLTTTIPFIYIPTSTYVCVRSKWKKDTFYDTLHVLNESKDLKTILTLKNIITRSPERCIPISAVSKMSRIFEIPGRVAAFLRKYPSFFEEFTGPQYDLPWFRLTREAETLDLEETKVFENGKIEFLDRLRRLILMTRERRLPLQIVHGMQWHLGLPEDFIKTFEDEKEKCSGGGGYECFQLVEMGNGVRGLQVLHDEKVDYPPLSVIQKNFLKSVKSGRSVIRDSSPLCLEFQFYPSKGVRLKRKITDWLEAFQKQPYISPYEHNLCQNLDPSGDLAEKRLVGVLHELFSLMVDHSAERRRLLCLRKHLELPQKFGRAFERHPHIFYLHMKNKTCYVVLKEGYNGGKASAIETHPMLPVREKYVNLMKDSNNILRKKRTPEFRSGENKEESKE